MQQSLQEKSSLAAVFEFAAAAAVVVVAAFAKVHLSREQRHLQPYALLLAVSVETE